MSDNIFQQDVATPLSERGLIAVTWVGAGLGVLFTSLRLAIRLTRLRRLLADDYCILLALAFLIANAVLQTLQAPHLYYIILTPFSGNIIHHVVMYLKYMFAIIGLFWSVLWSVKAAFLALFWAMTDHLPPYRRWWWAIVFFCFGSYAGCWITSAFTCHPPSSYFKFAQCTKPIDQRGSIIAISYSTTVDILSDLMIMAFGLKVILSTTMSFRQKVGLGIVFSLGVIIIVFAIVRAVNIAGRAYEDQLALAVWGIAESSISVIVGCLPPFKTFFTRKTSSAYTPSYHRKRPKGSTTQTTSSSEIPLTDYDSPRGRSEIRVTRGFSVLEE